MCWIFPRRLWGIPCPSSSCSRWWKTPFTMASRSSGAAEPSGCWDGARRESSSSSWQTTARASRRRSSGALQEGLAAATPISEKSSFGLFYIQERIRLCYGGEYGVTIDSVQGEGTQVMITLPEEWELGERYV